MVSSAPRMAGVQRVLGRVSVSWLRIGSPCLCYLALIVQVYSNLEYMSTMDLSVSAYLCAGGRGRVSVSYNRGMAYVRGERVLMERRQLDLTQTELARRIGIQSSSYISRIERNEVENLSLQLVYALADTLGVSPAYLLGFTDDPLAAMDDLSAALRESPASYSVLMEELQGLTAAQLRLARRVVSLFLALPASEQELALDVLERIEQASRPRIVGDE